MNKKSTSILFETTENTQNDTLTFKISTITQDRDSDILVPRGVRLENYKNNAIVQYGHNSYALPIGKTTKINVYDDYIEADVLFAPTAFAQECKALCREGFLNAASVGFIGLKSEDIPESKCGKKYTEWELLEWSIVNIPCNFQSLIQRAKQKGLKIDTFEKEVSKMDVTNVVVNGENVTEVTEVGVLSASDGPYETPVINEPVNENTDTTEATNNTDTIQTDTNEAKSIDNAIEKAGATISSANKSKIKAIHDEIESIEGTLKGCRDRLKEFIINGDEEPEEEPEKHVEPEQIQQKDIQPNNDERFKALEADMKQVLFLLQQKQVETETATDEQKEPENELNDDSEDEIDLDSIELPESEKVADLDELNIEPEQLKQLLNDVIKEVVQEEISKAKGGN